MSHLSEAKELQQQFPEETKGFSVFEVEKIWEEYSDSMCAGWLFPNKESVARVFSVFEVESLGKEE